VAGPVRPQSLDGLKVAPPADAGGAEGLAQYRREAEAADSLETSQAVADELDDFAGRFGASSAQSAPATPGSEAGTAHRPGAPCSRCWGVVVTCPSALMPPPAPEGYTCSPR
jgi:hypothetical protein